MNTKELRDITKIAFRVLHLYNNPEILEIKTEDDRFEDDDSFSYIIVIDCVPKQTIMLNLKFIHLAVKKDICLNNICFRFESGKLE